MAATDAFSQIPYFVAANGFARDAARLAATCSELGRGAAEGSLLHVLLLLEAKAPGPGLVTAHPRITAAARVGSFARVELLVRAGADACVRDGRGLTCLMLAARHGREAVVRGLLAMPGVGAALASARVSDSAPDAGHSALSLACAWLALGSFARKRERAAVRACVRALAASPLVGPGDVGGLDRSALAWACEARLPDVVSAWLADARCTAAVVGLVDDSDAEHTAFSLACAAACDEEHAVSDRARAAAAACARALAASPLVGPGDVGGLDRSALAWACWARLPDVVSAWLADARCTAAVVARADRSGETAFSCACDRICNVWEPLSESEHAAAAACARTIAASPFVGPGDAGGFRRCALAWACAARLPDVVAKLLGDPRCTAAVTRQIDFDGHSAFSRACAEAYGMDATGSLHERAASAACARVLAASPLVGPGDLGIFDDGAFRARRGRCALASACAAHLPDVVSAWLTDPRCTPAVIAHRDWRDCTAFSLACLEARNVPRALFDGAERAAAAACVRALAASPLVGPGDVGEDNRSALAWACEARLPDVVSVWLADARCTAAVVQRLDSDGASAFSAACRAAQDVGGVLSESERAAASACATTLAHSPHVNPAPGGCCISDDEDEDEDDADEDDASDDDGSSSDSEEGGGQQDHSALLLWACRGRLSAVVAGWVARPSCTRAVLTARNRKGASPFSAACAAARDTARYLSPYERLSAAACARAIAASPRTRPGDLGELGGSVLLWAAWAGLPDVVAALLASARCTRAVVMACDEGGESAFSVACAWAGDAGRVLTIPERAAAAACAAALAASPHLRLGDTTRAGHTALLCACAAGLAAVSITLLSRFDDYGVAGAAVVQQRDRWGRASAASALLERAAGAARLTADERRDTAACARALGGCRLVSSSERVQLLAAAAACAASVAAA